MERDRVQMHNTYKKKVCSAHEAFREKNFTRLAKLLFEKGKIAAKMYEIDGTDEWDIRTYGAYNAAGGAFEAQGDFPTASISYRLALASCKRIAAGRGPDWQKNIDHLKFLIERVSVR